MPTVTVRHARGSYPVHIETGLLVELRRLLQERLPGRRTVLISDETVRRCYDEWTVGTTEARQLGARSSDAGVRPSFDLRLTFPAGEASKTRDHWQRLTDQMLEARLGRDTVIVALGGGVTGDLAGFVAATYLRGIDWVQVPTTVVAMVDASVGGKVGVNTPAGKNLVGAFHPPVLVVSDPLTLMSLPDLEFRMGLAEAVKHGLIADPQYLSWMLANARAIRGRQPPALVELVQRSIAIKATIVEDDERESGKRAVLNAGHTVAHALEQASEFQLGHGEAVAIGLVVECRIAHRMGLLEPDVAVTVAGLLQRFGLPVGVPERLPRSALLDAMQQDKKNRGGEVRMALPRGLGHMEPAGGQWTRPVPLALIEEVLTSKVSHIST